MLETGDVAIVPVNVDHTFHVPCGQAVRVHNFHRPGGHFDAFIENQYRVVTSTRFKGLKRPSTALMMRKIRAEHTDLLVPSNTFLRETMALLARVARARGY
jgi:hypothetical protein